MADQIFYAQLLVDVAAAKEIRLFGLGRFLRGRMVDERQAAGSREYGYVPAEHLIGCWPCRPAFETTAVAAQGSPATRPR